MCAEELTTGSVMASTRERRLLAAQSHAFNMRQRRFAQLFPEYTGAVAKDLPNMSRPASAPAATKENATPALAPAPAAAEPAQIAPPAKADAPPAAAEPETHAPTSARPLVWLTAGVASLLFLAKIVEKIAQ